MIGGIFIKKRLKEETVKRNNLQKPIAFSCYSQNNREGENYVEQDTLQFQIAGTLTLFDGKKSYLSQKRRFAVSKEKSINEVLQKAG